MLASSSSSSSSSRSRSRRRRSRRHSRSSSVTFLLASLPLFLAGGLSPIYYVLTYLMPAV